MNFSIKEISEKTKLSQKTIRRHIAAGTLKCNKVANKYKISKKDLEKWVLMKPKLNNEKDLMDLFIENNEKFENSEDIDISNEWSVDGWKNSKERNGLTFVDLFAGAGGLSMGFVMAGFTPIATVEIMESAVDTYRTNFIDKKGFNEVVETRDIRDSKVKKKLYKEIKLKLKNKELDVICGGFPCQGFSMAGNRVITDPRNSLYLELLEIVKNVKPKFVVMENVEGLRSMLNGKVETKILNDFRKVGYEVSVKVLNAADYYTPQIRKRVIFIGNRVGKKNFHPKPLLKSKEYRTTENAIKDLQKRKDDIYFNHVRTKHSEEMKNRLLAVREGKSLYENYSDSWKKSPWKKPSCTIKENHGALNIHPKEGRVLTAREAARLQSFPDDFIFKGAKKWQLIQIGNAVPPLLGKAVAIAVEKSIKI